MKSPVIIVGAARSGTSMMMSSLKRVLEYTGHNEAHVFGLLNQLLQTIEAHSQPLRKAFEDQSDVLLFDPVFTLERDLKELFKSYVTQAYGHKPWMLKTPNSDTIKALPLILELFPNASLIFMKRRGIENVLSRSRKFGDGSFRAGDCTEWAECMKSFFSGDFKDRSLVIDQLAYMDCPDILITKLLDFLEIEATASLTEQLKNYLLSNPVQKTAPLTSSYIALEETPWSEEERSTFLEICGSTMKMSGYPISRAEINAFEPDHAFYFSGNLNLPVKALHKKTPWNTIPMKVFEPCQLHPNAIGDDALTLLLRPPAGAISLLFSMLNPNLTGKGVSICVTEVDSNDQVLQKIKKVNLRCLEKSRMELQPINPQPTIRIEITNEAGSENFNYKSLEMQAFPQTR